MKKFGVPLEIIKIKMISEGLNPNYFDNNKNNDSYNKNNNSKNKCLMQSSFLKDIKSQNLFNLKKVKIKKKTIFPNNKLCKHSLNEIIKVKNLLKKINYNDSK